MTGPIPELSIVCTPYGAAETPEPLVIDDPTILDDGYGYTVDLSRFGVFSFAHIKIVTKTREQE